MGQVALKSLTAAFVLSAFMVGPGFAGNWVYKKEEKAFGEIEATAMAMGDSSIVFVRCDSDGLSFKIATSEDWNDGFEKMAILSPSIIISIDGSPPARYDVSFTENQAHKVLAETTDDSVAKEAAEKLASANKRIDIGIEIVGKKYHTSRLSARGATAKIKSVLAVCAESQKPADDDAALKTDKTD